MTNSSELVFVRLVIPLIAGILMFSNGAPYSWLMILTVAGIALLCGLFYINASYSKFSAYKYKIYIIGGFQVLPFLFGGFFSLINTEINKINHFSKYEGQYLKVQVDEEPQLKDNTLRFKARVMQSLKENKSESVSGHLLVSLKWQGQRQTLNYGDQLFIPANFLEIPEPRNPSEFNAKSWYGRQNLYHQIFLPPGAFIIYKTGKGNAIIHWALRMRKRQVDLFRKLIHQDEANAVASTLILGYRADLSEETLMAYAKTGTIHALSVSGMHVGLIYLIINFLLNFLDKWKPGRILKLFLSIALIWIYALVAGLAPSILRSVIMLTVFIIGNTFKRNKNSYNLLCFSAFCILIYNPFLIYDVGFQLSYLSVLGLIYLQPYIYGWINYKSVWADKLWGFLALSLAAQLSTFPLAVYYFHQFPVYFLLSNLFILLPVSLIMYLGLLLILCRLYILAPVFEWLLKFTNEGLKWISSLPYASISEIWLSPAELLILCTSILFASVALAKYNKRLLFISLASGLLLAVSLALDQYQIQHQRKVLYFSLRSGSAIAFIDKEKAWLFSTFPRESKSMKYFVQPALGQAGITSITYLMPHESHKDAHLQANDHQIQFFSYKLLLVDTCFNYKSLNMRTTFNAINISSNSKLYFAESLRTVTTAKLFIDGSNAPYQADYYESVAQDFNMPSYNLKIKKAYLVNLNK